SRFAAGLPRDAAAALVIECEGHPHDVDADLEAAADACRAASAREVTVARDETQRLAIWQARKKAYGVLGRAAPDVFVQDAVVPRSELARLLPAIEEVARRQDLRLASFFHAGDGNLHPNFLFDRRDPEQVRRVECAGAEVMRLCVEAGGTITGEHGVGSDKVRYMSLVFGPSELAALHAVRAAFDPHGRANPGKLLPADGASDPAGPPVRSRSSSSTSRAAAFVAPVSEADIRALLADGGVSRGWAVTGAAVAPSRAPLPEEGVLSTARLDAIVALRPLDLVVTVGAGARIEDLARAAEEAGLWLPAGGPGAFRSVGGWIAAASPGPWDAAFGPVRRQILACRIVAFDGRCLAWGRGVMKNVAGYDVPRLVAGSRGRLGILTEVTLRLWPRPPAIAALDLAGEPDRLAAIVLALAGIPAGAEAHDGTLAGVVDGLSWTWTAGEPPRARARLAGPAESVRRRLEILRRTAMESGLHAEESDPWSVPTRDRSPESVAFRWAPGRRYVPGALDRLREVAGPALRRAEVLPLSGHVTATLERGVGPTDRPPVGPDLLRPWNAVSRPNVERGGPEDHAAARAVRDAGPREIERRVVAALGGAARIWQADFL
ncbi:MAG: FAD-linked oxidase C-terminal domain-containing protein, partial [Gemmatimonadota bacterium]|nr:FAD-linked oxidase C-terminal domain-containing protein [Gemmatimonadota bacterium]